MGSRMTTPLDGDFPDFGRYDNVSDVALFEESFGTNGPTSFGPFFVGLQPYVRLWMLSAANRLQLRVSWWNDEGLTQFIGDNFMVSPAAGKAIQFFPVIGPYVVFSLEASAYPSDYRIIARMTSGLGTNEMSSDVPNQPFRVSGAAVAAGANNTQMSANAQGGWAYWSGVFRGATSGEILLSAQRLNGTFAMLDAMGPDISTAPRLVFVPCMPLRVVATNNDAVPRNLYLSLLYKPYLV